MHQHTKEQQQKVRPANTPQVDFTMRPTSHVHIVSLVTFPSLCENKTKTRKKRGPCMPTRTFDKRGALFICEFPYDSGTTHTVKHCVTTTERAQEHLRPRPIDFRVSL